MSHINVVKVALLAVKLGDGTHIPDFAILEVKGCSKEQGYGQGCVFVPHSSQWTCRCWLSTAANAPAVVGSVQQSRRLQWDP